MVRWDISSHLCLVPNSGHDSNYIYNAPALESVGTKTRKSDAVDIKSMLAILHRVQ
jgi:hypothetical protein